MQSKKNLKQCRCTRKHAKLSKDNEQQLLFSQLANMERSHKSRLEDLYTNMAFPEVW